MQQLCEEPGGGVQLQRHSRKTLVVHKPPGSTRDKRRGAGGKSRVWRPADAAACPRCGSSNTKFCYFNNRNVDQPRYLCKGCQRYWTQGGSLRAVAVGAGCRKSKPGSFTCCSSLTPQVPPPPPPCDAHAATAAAAGQRVATRAVAAAAGGAAPPLSPTFAGALATPPPAPSPYPRPTASPENGATAPYSASPIPFSGTVAACGTPPPQAASSPPTSQWQQLPAPVRCATAAAAGLSELGFECALQHPQLPPGGAPLLVALDGTFLTASAPEPCGYPSPHAPPASRPLPRHPSPAPSSPPPPMPAWLHQQQQYALQPSQLLWDLGQPAQPSPPPQRLLSPQASNAAALATCRAADAAALPSEHCQPGPGAAYLDSLRGDLPFAEWQHAPGGRPATPLASAPHPHLRACSPPISPLLEQQLLAQHAACLDDAPDAFTRLEALCHPGAGGSCDDLGSVPAAPQGLVFRGPRRASHGTSGGGAHACRTPRAAAFTMGRAQAHARKRSWAVGAQGAGSNASCGLSQGRDALPPWCRGSSAAAAASPPLASGRSEHLPASCAPLVAAVEQDAQARPEYGSSALNPEGCMPALLSDAVELNRAALSRSLVEGGPAHSAAIGRTMSAQLRVAAHAYGVPLGMSAAMRSAHCTQRAAGAHPGAPPPSLQQQLAQQLACGPGFGACWPLEGSRLEAHNSATSAASLAGAAAAAVAWPPAAAAAGSLQAGAGAAAQQACEFLFWAAEVPPGGSVCTSHGDTLTVAGASTAWCGPGAGLCSPHPCRGQAACRQPEQEEVARMGAAGDRSEHVGASWGAAAAGAAAGWGEASHWDGLPLQAVGDSSSGWPGNAGAGSATCVAPACWPSA